MSSYEDTMADTIRANRIMNARRTEMKQLFSSFQQARQHYISMPNQNRAEAFKPVYDVFQRLQREMDEHRLATNLQAWTPEYFDEQLMILSNWVPKTCQYFLEFQNAGGDSEHALKCCLEFKAELEGVLNKRPATLAAKITDMIMHKMNERDSRLSFTNNNIMQN